MCTLRLDDDEVIYTAVVLYKSCTAFVRRICCANARIYVPVGEHFSHVACAQARGCQNELCGDKNTCTFVFEFLTISHLNIYCSPEGITALYVCGLLHASHYVGWRVDRENEPIYRDGQPGAERA